MVAGQAMSLVLETIKIYQSVEEGTFDMVNNEGVVGED